MLFQQNLYQNLGESHMHPNDYQTVDYSKRVVLSKRERTTCNEFS